MQSILKIYEYHMMCNNMNHMHTHSTEEDEIEKKKEIHKENEYVINDFKEGQTPWAVKQIVDDSIVDYIQYGQFIYFF